MLNLKNVKCWKAIIVIIIEDEPIKLNYFSSKKVKNNDSVFLDDLNSEFKISSIINQKKVFLNCLIPSNLLTLCEVNENEL